MEFRGFGLLGVILLGIACIAFAAKPDRDVKGPPGFSVKILGRSGAMTFIRSFNVTNKKTNKTMVRTKKIGVLMDEIKERDAEGNIVGKKGRNKHSFNGFANQDGTFSELSKTTFQSLSVQQINFTVTNIGGTGGDLNVIIYLFNEAGNITNGNETIEVRKGNLKFSIMISGWSFCGDPGERCRAGQVNETGDVIDFVITVKSRAGKKRTEDPGKCPRKKCPLDIEVGDGDSVILSKQVAVDGEWRDMPEGFPKFEPNEGKNMFTFRFPKFNNTVLYDPVFDLGSKPPPEPTAAPTPTSGAHHLGLSIAVNLILSAVVSYLHN